MEDLVRLYETMGDDINKKLDEYENFFIDCTNDELYSEMVYCMLAPKNNPEVAWSTVLSLSEKDYILNGSWIEINSILKENNIKYHKAKTKYIIDNRYRFGECAKDNILSMLNSSSVVQVRNKLSNQVIGFNMIDASRFIRNIGFGDSVSILNRPILKHLQDYGVISKMPNNLSIGEYIQIENEMRHFAQEIRVPVATLDLLFYYKSKGNLFK